MRTTAAITKAIITSLRLSKNSLRRGALVPVADGGALEGAFESLLSSVFLTVMF
jgi:hypothetical protein